MGMFKKLQGMKGTMGELAADARAGDGWVGQPSKELLEHGLLGRGAILDVQLLPISQGLFRLCTVAVEVTLDNQDSYNATCRQAFSAEILAQLQPGTAVVAVRVNPNNPLDVALDLNTPTPSVALKGDPGHSAAGILAHGTPCRAVIVESQDYMAKNAEGVEIYALMLTVIVDGRAPYQITVGNAVPDEALPLLYPGNNLPAKTTGHDELAIDWQAALAGYTQKGS